MFPAIGESPTMLSKGGNQDNDFYQGGNSTQLSLPARAQQIPMRIGKVGLDNGLRVRLPSTQAFIVPFLGLDGQKPCSRIRDAGKCFAVCGRRGIK